MCFCSFNSHDIIKGAYIVYIVRHPRRTQANNSTVIHIGFPSGSVNKESACNARDSGSIPGPGRCPGEGEWCPTPEFLPGEFHGQRSLERASIHGIPKSGTLLLSLSDPKRNMEMKDMD